MQWTALHVLAATVAWAVPAAHGRRSRGPTYGAPLYDELTGELRATPETPVRHLHTDSAAIAAALERDGYAVVREVLPDGNELSQARSSIWRNLASLSFGPPPAAKPPWGLAGGDVREGGTLREWDMLRQVSNPFGMPWPMSQSEWGWRIRSLPALAHVFSHSVFNGTSDLIVSFDVGSIYPPSEVEEAVGIELLEGWLHVDQNPIWRPGRQTIQSLVTCYDADESTGSFVVYPGSHTYHHEIASAALARSRSRGAAPPAVSENFVQIQSSDVTQHMPTHAYRPPVLLRMRAGDAIFWDSRVVHMVSQGHIAPRTSRCTPANPRRPRHNNHTPPLIQSSPPSTRIPPVDRRPREWGRDGAPAYRPARAVVYVSMTPRRWATDAALLRRQEAFANCEPCTHWPFTVERCTSNLNPGPIRDQLPLPPAPPLGHMSPEAVALIGFTDGQIEAARRRVGGSTQHRRRHDTGFPPPPFCDREFCYNLPNASGAAGTAMRHRGAGLSDLEDLPWQAASK